MRPSGQRNTRTLLRRENNVPLQFEIGPVKFLSYLPREAAIPQIAVSINGKVHYRNLPAYFELREAQNFIDFQIISCDESFSNLIVGCNINDRIGIKLSHGNKIGRIYRLFPTGTLQRLNEETSQNE